MPSISLPSPGQKPWNLNPAITALNDEMETGRLSVGQLNATIAQAVIDMNAGPNSGIVFYFAPDGCLVMAGEEVAPPALPEAPTGLTPTAGRGEVALSWTAPAPAFISDYTIQYRAVGAGSWTTFAHAPSTSTTATITGLTNGIEHEARVAAVNSTGVGPFVTSGSFTPGLVNGVVLEDLFTRSAANLIGSNATSGQPWVGTGSNFSVDGSKAVSGGSPALTRVDAQARGIASRKLEASVLFSTINTGVSKNVRLYPAWIGTANYLYIRLTLSSAGAFSIAVIGGFDSTTPTTLSTGFPAGTLPAATAAAWYPVSIEIAGTTVTATVNGTTRTATLTAPQAASIINATEVAIYSDSAEHAVDTLNVSVNGTYV